MGRGITAYVFKLESDLKGNELEQTVLNTIIDNSVDEGIEKKHRKGFIDLNVEEHDFPVQRPKLYYIEYNDKISAIYREYKEEYDKYDHEMRFSPKDINILYDSKKRVLIIRTSQSSDATKLLNMFDGLKGSIRFRQPTYTHKENFFRWVIDNSKDGRDKFPNPCKLENVEYVNVKDLVGSPNHSTTESVIVSSVEHISDDQVYRSLKNEGTRFSFKGNFLHSRWPYGITVYTNGKITLGKQPPKTDESNFTGMFSVAFEEMEHLYQAYIDDVGNLNAY